MLRDAHLKALRSHIFLIEPPKSAGIYQRTLMKPRAHWPSYSEKLQRCLHRWSWNRPAGNLSERDDHLTLILRLSVARTSRGGSARRGLAGSREGARASYLS